MLAMLGTKVALPVSYLSVSGGGSSSVYPCLPGLLPWRVVGRLGSPSRKPRPSTTPDICSSLTSHCSLANHTTMSGHSHCRTVRHRLGLLVD